MKKILYALLAISATLTFASCNDDFKEDGSDSPVITENTLVFTLKKNDITTRSESGVSAARNESYPLGDPIDGQQIYLKETVSSLDNVFYSEPETKGTPVYTDNFSEVSGGIFRGLAFPVTKMPVSPAVESVIPDGVFSQDGDRWLRDVNPWGSNDALLFYGRMLTEDTNPNIGQRVGVLSNSYEYIYSEAGVQSMTFSYRSAATAEDQQDVLFAARTITKDESPIPIVFYHPLTGVKFATAHANDGDVKTYIKKVEFTGLYGYGKCTVTSTAEGNGYSDDPSDHSSARAISWAFTGNSSTNSLKNVYSQEFPETPVTYSGGSFSNKGDYPSSFSSAGNKNNLNDGDATMTFWFPPQVIGMDADGTNTHATKLKITFEIEMIDGSRKEYTREIDLGALTSNAEWKAGELRTLTLLSTEVDVEIEDKVEGYVKKDVVITNVGNTPAYMRAQIVGGWYGKAGSEEGVAMGFASDDDADFEYVTPWNAAYELDSPADYTPYGAFAGLPGSNWIKGADGYYYYTEIVYPGDATADKFFTSYTLDSSKIPSIYYVNSTSSRVPFTDVRLVIDIPVQAVAAPLKSGSTVDNPQYEDYIKAWETAGVTAPSRP